MIKSILFALLVGYVSASVAMSDNKNVVVEIITVNVIDPFVEAVIENTLTVVEQVVETVVDFVVDTVTGFVGWLFGKREVVDMLSKNVVVEIITVNVIDPFVESVIENTLTVVEQVVETVVDAVVGAVVGVVTGFTSWLFGKRGIEFNAVVSIIQSAVPVLVNAITGAVTGLLTTLKPLAKQQIASTQVLSEVTSALAKFDNQVKVATHKFLSTVLNVAQTVLAMPQLNQLTSVLSSALNFLNNLTHIVQAFVQMAFTLLQNQVVSNLLGHLLG